MKLRRTFQFSPMMLCFLPLLNVLFLVLVFWVLGSKFILQPGVPVSLPATTFALGPQRNAELVTITAGPAPAIYHKDKKVTLPELAARLVLNKAVDRTIIVRADQAAPTGTLHEVMNEAQKHGFRVIWAGAFPPS